MSVISLKYCGGDWMPNIKPISDLRNYSEVLRDVTIDSPVFLTKNGRGRYAIMDIQDYERVMATIKLMGALESTKSTRRFARNKIFYRRRIR